MAKISYVIYTCKSHIEGCVDTISVGKHIPKPDGSTDYTYIPLHKSVRVGTPLDKIEAIVALLVEHKAKCHVLNVDGKRRVEIDIATGDIDRTQFNVIPLHINKYYDEITAENFWDEFNPRIVELLQDFAHLVPGWVGFADIPDDLVLLPNEEKKTDVAEPVNFVEQKKEISKENEVVEKVIEDLPDELAGGAEEMLIAAVQLGKKMSIASKTQAESEEVANVVPTAKEEHKVEEVQEESIFMPESSKKAEEPIPKQTEEITLKQEEPAPSMPIIDESCLTPKSQWANDFCRVPIDELVVFPVVCESEYSVNPIIKGFIRLMPTTVEDTDEETGESIVAVNDDGETTVTYELGEVLLGDLLSSEFSLLVDSRVDYILNVFSVKPKYNFQYEKSITVDVILKRCDGSIVFGKKASQITDADIKNMVDSLPALETSDKIFDVIKDILTYDGLQDRLDLHTFIFNPKLLANVPSDQIHLIQNYDTEQMQMYGIKPVASVNEDTDALFFDLPSLVGHVDELEQGAVQPFATLRAASVPNLRKMYIGLHKKFEFNDCAYWKEVLDSFSAFNSRRDEITELMEGSYGNSFVESYESEKALRAELENYVMCGLILEHGYASRNELEDAIARGEKSILADAVLKQWCKAALSVNWASAGHYVSNEISDLFGYSANLDVDAIYYPYYHVTEIGSGASAQFRRDYRPFELASLRLAPAGFEHLEDFMNKYTKGSFAWVDAFVRTLRWGSRKGNFLVLGEQYQSDRTMGFEYVTSATTKLYTKANFDKLVGFPLYPATSLDAGYTLTNASSKAQVFPQYEKVLNFIGESNRPVAIPSYVQMKRVNKDLELIEILSVDTVSLVESLWKHNCYIEDKSGITTPVNWISKNNDLQRISVDDGLFSTGSVLGASFFETRDETLCLTKLPARTKADMVMECIGRPKTTRDLQTGVQRRNSTKVSCAFMDKLAEFCSRAGYVNDKYMGIQYDAQSPFKLLRDFYTLNTLHSNRPGTVIVKEFACEYVFPFLVAAYLYSAYVNKYGNSATEGNASSFEVKLNCVLFGYLFGTQQLGMPIDAFLEAVHDKSTALSWTQSPDIFGNPKIENNNSATKYFKLGVDSFSAKVIGRYGEVPGAKHYRLKDKELELRLIRDAGVYFVMFLKPGDLPAGNAVSVDSQVMAAQLSKVGYKSAYASAEVQALAENIFGKK